MNNISSFLKLIKFEFIRIWRNKIILSMLILFPIIILLIMSSVNFDITTSNTHEISNPVGIFYDGMSKDDIDIATVFGDVKLGDNVIEYSTKEEGIKNVQNGKLCMLICLRSDQHPVKFDIIYDGASNLGIGMRNALQSLNNNITEYLESIGITLNSEYFNLVNFQSSTVIPAGFQQRNFVMELACGLAVVLMFGLAYSISRDNETGASRQLAYTPIGIQKYLLSKVVPYFIIAFLISLVCFGLGNWLFGISYSWNFFAILLITALFILSSLMLGLVFSLMKSQIATAFLDMLAVILPIFVSCLFYIGGFPLILQIGLYAMPITSFIFGLNYILFNCVIVWKYIAILILLIVVYYLTTVLILRKKNGK